ncbi:MAG: hypothetical protein JNL50_09450 [Phycisphaerae bacterium]|nr:hypothetical protein [Phycisphaerae bacterium]
MAMAPGGAIMALGAIVACGVLTACEERMVSNHPMLGGLPGAETATPVTAPPGASSDPTAVAGQLRVVDEAGKATLVARAPRHLMKHIYNTVFDNEPLLFVEQVLSETTKDEYFARGVDVSEAFATLRERREDIHALFNAMPRGEQTPGLFIEPLGGGAQRLCVYGRAARGLRWNGFDMVMEKGNWKLRWFINNQR